MNYEEELRRKLEAVRPVEVEDKHAVVDIDTLESKILSELNQEFAFGQYDLDESDILRTLKILQILEEFSKAFSHPKALKLFYIMCRVDVITPKHLHQYSQLSVADFKGIINAMAHRGLIYKNEENELELTLEGKSLATRIGVDLYL